MCGIQLRLLWKNHQKRFYWGWCWRGSTGRGKTRRFLGYHVSRTVRKGRLFNVWPCNCFPFSQYFCISVLESVSLLVPSTVTRIDLREDPHQSSWSWFFLGAKGCLFHDSRERRLAFSSLPLCLWRSHMAPPHPLHTLRGSRAMREWSRVPREMHTGCVCVILQFLPWVFTPSKVNYFINSCHVWQAFLKSADSFIRTRGRLRQTLGNVPFLEFCIPTPQLSQLLNINFYPRPDRWPHAPCSNSALQLTIDNGFLSPREKLLLGFPLHYRIME